MQHLNQQVHHPTISILINWENFWRQWCYHVARPILTSSLFKSSWSQTLNQNKKGSPLFCILLWNQTDSNNWSLDVNVKQNDVTKEIPTCHGHHSCPICSNTIPAHPHKSLPMIIWSYLVIDPLKALELKMRWCFNRVSRRNTFKYPISKKLNLFCVLAASQLCLLCCHIFSCCHSIQHCFQWLAIPYT